jgi:hypothetical protein
MQAIEYADSVVPAERRYNDIYYAIASGKHAKLIVDDCLDQLEKINGGSTDEWDKAVRSGITTIKEHFGVES